MRIVSEETLDQFRTATHCEACGQKLRHASEAAHIYARGMGGGSRLDIRINLCALGGPWDCACHHHSHNGSGPNSQQLIEVAARREGVTAESLEVAIYALRRAPKGSDAEEVMRCWLRKA